MYPKCDLCGSSHAPYQAHRFVSAPVNEPRPVSAGVNALHERIRELEARVVELEAENLTLKRPKVDRKAYMREYMRKRRQK